MASLELSRLILVAIGLILGAVSALFFSRSLKTSRRFSRSLTLVMGLATGLVAAVSSTMWVLERRAPPSDPRTRGIADSVAAVPAVSITSPPPQSQVTSVVQVTGTFSVLPLNAEIWVLVRPSNSPLWWPQPEPVKATGRNGTWQQTVVLGGGDKFDIAAVVASKDASVQLAEYVRRGSGTGSYPGIPLPPGARPVDAVEVIKGKR